MPPSMLSLFDLGFMASFMSGNPAISIGILSVFYMLIGLDDHQKLFAIFSGAAVCATCFKDLKWARPSMGTETLIISQSLALGMCYKRQYPILSIGVMSALYLAGHQKRSTSLLVALALFMLYEFMPYDFLEYAAMILLEGTIYTDNTIWITKVFISIFFYGCVKGSGLPEEQLRNVFMLASFACVFSINMYNRMRGGEKEPETQKTDPATD